MPGLLASYSFASRHVGFLQGRGLAIATVVGSRWSPLKSYTLRDEERVRFSHSMLCGDAAPPADPPPHLPLYHAWLGSELLLPGFHLPLEAPISMLPTSPNPTSLPPSDPRPPLP